MLVILEDVKSVLSLRAVIVIIICVKNAEIVMLIVVAMENVFLAGQRSIVGQKGGLVVNVKNGIVTIVEILLKIVARNAGQISK
jgi:hypothetical protein